MELSVAQIIILALAGFTYGISKTGVFGIATIIVPMLLYLFTPGQALGIAIPMLAMADTVAIYLYRKTVCWRLLLFAVPWALAGIFLGWRVLLWADAMPGHEGDALLRKLISVLIIFVLVAGAAVKVLRKRFEPDTVDSERIHAPFTVTRVALSGLVAFIGGFITMVSNNSAPAWVVLLMLFQLQKYYFLGTAAWIVFCLNTSKIPFAVDLGYVNLDTLLINLYMMPLLALGLITGRKIAANISQRFFDILTQSLAFIGGVYLLLTA